MLDLRQAPAPRFATAQPPTPKWLDMLCSVRFRADLAEYFSRVAVRQAPGVSKERVESSECRHGSVA